MRRIGLAIFAAMMSLTWGPSPGAAATPAQGDGHVRSSIWSVDGATVRVRVTIPVEAARKLAAAHAPPPSVAIVAAAVSQGIGVTTPAGDCEAIDQGEGVGQIYTLAPTPGLDRFEIVFACPQASGLVLKDAVLVDRDPNDIDYAQIQIGAGRPVLDVFTRDKRGIALPAAPDQLRGADPFAWAGMAAIGLVSGLTSFPILVGSALFARGWLGLVWLSGSRALGYLTSILLALSGLVILDQGLASALLGLLMATLGVGLMRTADPFGLVSTRWRTAAWAGASLLLLGLIGMAMQKNPLVGLATFGIAAYGFAGAHASRIEPKLGALAFGPAAAFAFMDGLGAASDLALAHPAASQWVPALLGQDLGGWLAGVAIASCAMGLIWVASLRLQAWKAIGSESAGAVLISSGLFWFVTRVFETAGG